MTEAVGKPAVTDTSDMFAIHKVFRDALASAPALVGTVAPGDTARSAVVGSYYYNVLRFLEGHHEGEDELVTPRLVERCSAGEVELVEAIAGQHRWVEAPIESTQAALKTWTAEADSASAAQLLASLDELQSALISHLDQEEVGILPLASAHLTAQEWGELPGHGLRSFAGDNVWLVIGLIREGFNDEQRGQMLAHMPPPVAEAWKQVGESAFLGFIGELRGS